MDETRPLLVAANGNSSEEDDLVVVVDFDPAGDADNPVDWPRAYKWSVVALLALNAFMVTFTCVSIVPIAKTIASDLANGDSGGGDSSDPASTKQSAILFVTIWELGEAAGPLLIAPLSERYGRSPVMNAANACFVAATCLAALSTTGGGFVAARMLTGAAVSANVMNPAVVGDVFAAEQRGAAMSVVALAPLIGGVVGPIVGGAIVDHRAAGGWRVLIWVCVGLAAVCEGLFFVFFRETYKVTILQRRAAGMMQAHQEEGEGGPADGDGRRKMRKTRVVVRGQEDGPGAQFWEAAVRPFAVLLSSGVLQAISAFSSVVFTYYYVQSTTLPSMLADLYHLSNTAVGLSFVAFSLGAVLGTAVCNVLLDGIYVRLGGGGKEGQPELRLPLAIAGGFLLPVSVAAYGWCAQLRLPLPLLLLSVVAVGLTVLLAFLPVLAYVVDAFSPLYSASAMTAVIVTRCLVSAFLPVLTGWLADTLGYGWGFTVLMGVSLCFAPVPVFVFRYGGRWRQRSVYTRRGDD